MSAAMEPNTLHQRLSEFTTTRQEAWPAGKAGSGALLEVREGVSAEDAIELSCCIDSSVRHCLKLAVQDGMDPHLGYLCWFASEVSNALRSAAGVEV
jgi:hypothetical protein